MLSRLLVLLALCNAAITPKGPHAVQQATTTGMIRVYYPASEGTFPLIAFAHGAGAGGPMTGLAYTGWYHALASHLRIAKKFYSVAT